MDKIIELLSSLATTLGKTAQELWPYAVRHTSIEALSFIFAWVVLSLITWLTLHNLREIPWMSGRENDKYPSGRFIVAIALGLVLFITTVVFASNFAAVLEPTGHTVKEILSSIKTK